MRATSLAAAVGLAFALHCTAAGAAELPVGLVEMLEEVNATLDVAEWALAGESFSEADDLLERADDTLYEAERRFGDQVPQDHPDLVAVWERFDKLRVDVRAAKRAAMAGSAEATPETSGLPPGLAELLDRVHAVLDDFERALAEGDVQGMAEGLAATEKLGREVERTYGEDLPEDHPAIVAITERFEAVMAEIESSGVIDEVEELMEALAEEILEEPLSPEQAAAFVAAMEELKPLVEARGHSVGVGGTFDLSWPEFAQQAHTMPVVERHGFDQHSWVSIGMRVMFAYNLLMGEAEDAKHAAEMDKRSQKIDSSWDEDEAVVAPLMDRLKRLLGAE